MYRIEYSRQAIKALRRAPAPVSSAIREALVRLASDPDAARNVRRLVGVGAYRLRVGDWRVVFDLDRDALLVIVIRIATRAEVHR
ncbi:MAG: type II toxin-antitoxin system RelE family toxin [Burkholderiales bacterium]